MGWWKRLGNWLHAKKCDGCGTMGDARRMCNQNAGFLPHDPGYDMFLWYCWKCVEKRGAPADYVARIKQRAVAWQTSQRR